MEICPQTVVDEREGKCEDIALVWLAAEVLKSTDGANEEKRGGEGGRGKVGMRFARHTRDSSGSHIDPGV